MTVQVEYLEPEGLQEEYERLGEKIKKGTANQQEITRFNRVKGKIISLIEASILEDFDFHYNH